MINNLDLDYYRKYSKQANSQKEYKKQQEVIKLSEQYSKQYNSQILFFDVLINSDRADILYRHEKITPIKCVVDYNKKWSKNTIGNPFARELWTKHNELKVGEVVDFESKISKDKKIYILTRQVENEQGYDIFQMTECNNHITILCDNNKIIKIPCVKTNATMYGDGIYENKTMSILDGMIKVTVQKNEITNKFERNMYFIFNHKNKYEISSIYTDEDSGILDIIMKEVAVNFQTDNLELNIADYIKIKHNYEIIVQDSINVKVGEKYKINYTIKDNNIEVTDKSILDKMVILSKNLDVITVDNQGFVTPLKKGKGVIELSLEIENEEMNKTIQVSVLEEDSKNFNMEVISEDNEFTVDSLFDKTFSVIFKNNDELVSDKAIFSIRNKDNRIREPLATIKSFTDNSCVISANKKAKYGIVILKAESQSGMCKIEKEIMVKNPFS